MTVIETNKIFNLRHENGVVMEYSKSEILEGFNGYEAGTSIVKKSLLQDIGREGAWSWEETVYQRLSGNIHAHIDDTPFWDMGTPERLLKLEEFFKNSRT